MAKEFASTFYQSRRWRDARAAYISMRLNVDGGVCEVCHSKLGEIVHHIEHLTARNISDPEVAFGLDNLQYVCLECHNQFEGHGVGFKAGPAIARFDAEGNPWPAHPPI